MTRDQKIVAIGALSGVLSMGLAVWFLHRALATPSGLTSVGDRLGYALRWDAVAAVPLFLMIGTVGNARALSKAIDPTLGAESPSMIVDGRVADNTTQQFLLFLAGSLGLAASLPAERMTLIAAAAIWFVAARLAFWIGYRIHPLYRAFGFAGSACLNLGLIAAALWLGFR